jgi:glycosyltransferase involved in cell wall biosynthesis
MPVTQIDSRTLLFLGRISWKKGLDRLIPALHYLPGVQLLVAGNDEEGLRPSLEQLARDHGVARQIQFLGAVDGRQKDQVLRQATILVLPSYNENFGNVILESLIQGRPVAVTREVGLAGAVEAAGVGRILPPDPVGMAGVLTDMLADKATLDAMGALGRTWVAQNFSWPAIAQQMETIYRRMRDGVAA